MICLKSKEDVVAFANKYLETTYVVFLKEKAKERLGKNRKTNYYTSETNADKQSPFVKMVNDMPATPAKTSVFGLW